MTITSLGLIFDMIGVLILFYSGLPFKMPERNLYIEESLTPEQIKKDKKQNMIAYIGLTNLLLGFVLQFFGSLN